MQPNADVVVDVEENFLHLSLCSSSWSLILTMIMMTLDVVVRGDDVGDDDGVVEPEDVVAADYDDTVDVVLKLDFQVSTVDVDVDVDEVLVVEGKQNSTLHC